MRRLTTVKVKFRQQKFCHIVVQYEGKNSETHVVFVGLKTTQIFSSEIFDIRRKNYFKYCGTI